MGGTAKVSVDVANTGSREGDEVPQLYIHQKIASVTRPVMQLEGFQRITLKPGEKKTVEFTITPEMLSMLNVDMHRVVEPGIFDVMVGPSSDQTTTVPLHVVGEYGETGLAALPSAPAGSESGVVSTFDGGKVAANYGSWITGSDAMQGGKSIAKMEVVDGGAENSKGALRVTGEIIPGAPFTWAGALFVPGSSPVDPVNLSSKKVISFWAKGDGKTYAIAVGTQAKQNQMPAIKTFVAGAEWKQYSFPISAFDTEGEDITNLAFAQSSVGNFEFEIDRLEIK